MERNKAVIDKAREELQEGLASLNDQQKMIRMADSSENCWGAVKETKVCANLLTIRRIVQRW